MGRSELTVGGTVDASWTALGTSGAYAIVVQDDKDSSSVMKSCFVIIVVNEGGGPGSWGDQNRLLEKL